MRLHSDRPANAVLLSSLFFPSLIYAVGNLNCETIVTNGQVWKFGELGGPRSVMVSDSTPQVLRNTTYTIDICSFLKRSGNVDKGDKCPGGTRVCAIERTIKTEPEKDEDLVMITKVIPIAGELGDSGGGPLDAQYKRLPSSDFEGDEERQGLRIELNGGFYGEKPKRSQRAVIDFLCDPERIGTETDLDPDYKSTDAEDAPANNGRSLEFISYDKDPSDANVDMLRLQWHTKLACVGQEDNGGAAKGTHWGFFTWFLIIGFLVTAAYLIFGSWLNYNRYGARGWDLLPHGDTIRDVPYLLKDWTRRVVNTVQGSGSRGGYSAV